MLLFGNGHWKDRWNICPLSYSESSRGYWRQNLPFYKFSFSPPKCDKMGARRVGLLASPWICCDPAALHQLRKSPTLSQFYLYLTLWWYDILCKTCIVDTYANILVCLMSFCVHTQYLLAEKFLCHGNLMPNCAMSTYMLNILIYKDSKEYILEPIQLRAFAC